MIECCGWPIAPVLGSQGKRIGVCTRDKAQALFANVGLRASCFEMEGMAAAPSLPLSASFWQWQMSAKRVIDTIFPGEKRVA